MTQHLSGPFRSEASRRAILGATARLFAERGYDQLTIEGIAAEAKVGKQTIYRWWGSKSALVAECMLAGALLPETLSVPDTGDLRADLTAWMGSILAFVDAPENAALIRSLIAVATENADVGRLLGAAIGRDSSLPQRLAVGQAAGQLRESAPLEDVSKALVGLVIVHALERSPASPGEPAALVAAVLP